MRISTKGRYALEALLYMAMLPGGQYVSTRSIADSTGLSDGYLEQLFIPLRQAGIIRGIRGPRGGYLPDKPLEAISVGEVLRVVEGPLEPVDCVSSRDCPVMDNCASRHTWSELYREIAGCVDSISLQDLVEAYETMDQMEYVI